MISSLPVGLGQVATESQRDQPENLPASPNVLRADLIAGENMDPVAAARREVALEIQRLAEEFEASDEAAFRRSRIICWGVTAAVTIVILALLVMGGDRRYLGFFWVVIIGLTWAGPLFSSYRQRRQTSRLRALATRWLGREPPPATG